MKFLIDNMILVLLVVLSSSALLLSVFRKPGRRASILQAVQLINQGKTTVLDIRHSEIFAAAHVSGSKNIPLKELLCRINELDSLKKNILIVCDTGSKSPKAIRTLYNAGFKKEAYYLEGGMLAWQDQGLPSKKC